MIIRLSLALLFALLVSAPSQALLLRRVIEHRAIGTAASSAFCQADAARLCLGVAEGNQMQCLMQYKDQVTFPCKKELRKLEMRSGQ